MATFFAFIARARSGVPQKVGAPSGVEDSHSQPTKTGDVIVILPAEVGNDIEEIDTFKFLRKSNFDAGHGYVAFEHSGEVLWLDEASIASL